MNTIDKQPDGANRDYSSDELRGFAQEARERGDETNAEVYENQAELQEAADARKSDVGSVAVIATESIAMPVKVDHSRHINSLTNKPLPTEFNDTQGVGQFKMPEADFETHLVEAASLGELDKSDILSPEEFRAEALKHGDIDIDDL